KRSRTTCSPRSGAALRTEWRGGANTPFFASGRPQRNVDGGGAVSTAAEALGTLRRGVAGPPASATRASKPRANHVTVGRVLAQRKESVRVTGGAPLEAQHLPRL